MVWFRKKVTFYVFLFFRKAFCLKVPHKGVSSHLFRKLIWKELSRMKLDFRGPADDWAAHLLLIFAHLYLINSQSWTNERTNERTFRSQFFFTFFSSTMLRQKLWLLPKCHIVLFKRIYLLTLCRNDQLYIVSADIKTFVKKRNKLINISFLLASSKQIEKWKLHLRIRKSLKRVIAGRI
jgi:hypothetical protein